MTTPHADRDRSEPYWPPAAPAAYAHDIDEPVPFILTDEPQGELVTSIFDHEAGEIVPMVPLMRAPEGTLLHCATCPATLADTRGGRLVHHDDGSHTLVPPDGSDVVATDGSDIDPELHALRTVVESAIPALRSEAKGLRVGTFLRPANAPTAAVLESVADLLAAAVEP